MDASSLEGLLVTVLFGSTHPLGDPGRTESLEQLALKCKTAKLLINDLNNDINGRRVSLWSFL